MNGSLRINRTWFAGLLGAALLAGSPIIAQADQGKWWEPKGRGPSRERRVERQVRYDRGGHRVYRQSRPSFQRSYVTIRDGRRGYRARRVWASPYYLERQHLVVIRPVRYFVTAGAYFGGVRVSARFHDHDRYLYGCNFCDARFSGYDAYHTHVMGCDYRPSGYRLDVSDWSDDWDNEACDVDDCEIHGGHHHHGSYGSRDDDDYCDDGDYGYDR